MYIVLLNIFILFVHDNLATDQCLKQDLCKISKENLYSQETNNVTSIHPDNKPLVYTVATAETDGYHRYLYSAHEYGIKPIVLGLGEEWKGGDVQKGPGGGQKINLLLNELKQYKNNKNQVAIFTDAYDVIFLQGLDEIVKRFKYTGARVLFSAEAACWPNADLANLYPPVTVGKPYLNSGLYMGYVPELIQLLNYSTLQDTDDDQLFFTRAYLNEHLREHLKIKLDHKSEIFQNLQGATNEVEMYSKDVKEGSEYVLNNVVTHTEPLILHGNGPSKLYLNALGNYLARSWDAKNGCHYCKSGHISFENVAPDNMPIVFVALFIEQPTPFLEEQLEKIGNLEYPKHRIHLFIHNNVKYHIEDVNRFIEKHGTEYISVKEIKPEDGTVEMIARDLSIDQFLNKKCELYFSVDSIAHLDNPHTLRLLVEQNRTVVAPLLTRPGKAWSNFWGALTTDGYYARSNDYMDIVHNTRRGLWNVPYVSACYLVNATLFHTYDRKKLTYVHDQLDPDMAFCEKLRNLNVFMYLSNRIDFGHLINPETFDVTRTKPDMYQLFENELDWENRYIHPDYKANLNPDKKPAQPCPDVYWFPVVSVRFCDDLISMMEAYGKWSDGSNQDTRLEGGYEAVPTRDIHMTQVGWDRHWLHFLDRYVSPLQELVFIGYYHNPPRSLMNFVVRYRPDEQSSLRPHHDSSTYTINIALNQRGIDYEGGGCRFIRYNCSVVDTKQGWILIHPGRLTHFHEGLLVTKGTRYIMISFVDP